MNVPIAPIGLSVIVGAGDEVTGVYPEVLRNMEARDGCSFKFSVVPRARLEVLFESGKADLLIPATRTPRRDEFGVFVPLIFSRATLVSVTSERPPMLRTKDLLDRSEFKVGVVRGFDYGPAYGALVTELAKQGRLLQDVDALSVARLLQIGAVDGVIISPATLLGAIKGELRTEGLSEKLRFEPLEEFTWSDSGAYISKVAISDTDEKVLIKLLERASTSGAVWKAFQKYYPAKALQGSIRAR